MMVTTGGRGSTVRVDRRICEHCCSTRLPSARIGVWPNSSTTSVAVSWSMGWLIVAITPIFIIVLMTSLALTAMRLASSPTGDRFRDLDVTLDRRGRAPEIAVRANRR